MMRLILIGGAFVVAIAGCDRPAPMVARNKSQPTATATKAGNQKVEKPNESNAKQANNREQTGRQRRGDREPHPSFPPFPTGASNVGIESRDLWSGGVGFTESQAIARVERLLKEAVQYKPTVVVWLFDLSPSAASMRKVIAPSAAQLPVRLKASGGGGAANKLLTAVVTFGADVNVVTSEPVEDTAALSLDRLSDEQQPTTKTYAAVKAAAEKFAPLRMTGQEVMFVLVAREDPTDEANAGAAAAALRKANISVYGIGPAAPFGRLHEGNLTSKDAPPPVESRFAERIGLYFGPGDFGMQLRGDVELSDSGYGPFGLERLCRQSEGRFLRLRPMGSPGWKSEDDGEVKSVLLRKYAPDYVTTEEYQQILKENKACMALHEAAKLPPTRVLVAAQTDFRQEEQAAMARRIGEAQRAPAIVQDELAKLHTTLAAGEADRARLTRPRWQAAFDLAYGRTCAARARADGYNAMLAALRNGKQFKNAGSTIWSLKPAEGIEGNSQLDKMAKTGKALLERVMKDHAGTPWAAMAARELETPCGWEWVEK
jgi:hypothetical protein